MCPECSRKDVEIKRLQAIISGLEEKIDIMETPPELNIMHPEGYSMLADDYSY